MKNRSSRVPINITALAPWRRSAKTTVAPVRVEAPVAGWMSRDEAIMGTAIRVELWADDARMGEAAMQAVMAEMHHVDQTMSPHKPVSELSIVNREAAQRAVPLSPEMFDLVDRAIRFSELSHGAFDITYASVGHLFDYREGIRPTDAQIEAARACVGWRHLILDRAARTLRFAKEGVRIDLGGFAKGHAVDNAIAILRHLGVEHAMVSAGGDSHVLGDKRGRPWSIAIADPRRPGEVVAVLPLVDTAISTSGDYERCFECDGVRYHHIIDPKTGHSASKVRSATILAPTAMQTDGLSKTAFVLGAEAALEIIETIPGVDAIFVTPAGKVLYTKGLAPGS